MKKFIAANLVAVSVLCGGFALADTERFIHLDGVENTRDLGGLTTGDGRTVKVGLLIRSGEIDEITDKGKATLDTMGVSTIIDLRTTKEATAHPAEWPAGTGPARHHFPLMEDRTDLIDEMRAHLRNGTARADWMDAAFQDSFGYIATDYPQSIRSVFEVLLKNVILTTLGVPRDQITEDALLTNVAIDADVTAGKMAAKINADRGTTVTAEDVWPALGVRKAYVDNFYNTVEAKYGSIDEYLVNEIGLTEADVEVLRARYLE
jgi:protein-tyrosine phosphatase